MNTEIEIEQSARFDLQNKIRSEVFERIKKETRDVRISKKSLWMSIGMYAGFVLVAFAAVFIARYYYNNQIEDVVRNESRFITTEWHILRELQLRTNRLLEEKDQEIALLRQLYSEAAIQDSMSEEAESIKNQLKRAYAEREVILQAWIAPSEESLADLVDIEQTLETETREAGHASRQIVIAGMDPKVLAWYRQIIDDLRFGKTAAALERLDSVENLSNRMLSDDIDRLYGLSSIVERNKQYIGLLGSLEKQLARRDIEVQQAQEKITDLENSVDELKKLIFLNESSIDSFEDDGEKVDIGLAYKKGVEEMLLRTETLVAYLSGAEMNDQSAARDELVEQWQNNRRFRELIIRVRRLAEGGISPERDDLPRPRLVAIATNVEGDRVLAETLTDLKIRKYDTVELRSREGIQPGALLGTGIVASKVDTLLILDIREKSDTIKPRDLVYVVIEE